MYQLQIRRPNSRTWQPLSTHDDLGMFSERCRRLFFIWKFRKFKDGYDACRVVRMSDGAEMSIQQRHNGTRAWVAGRTTEAVPA